MSTVALKTQWLDLNDEAKRVSALISRQSRMLDAKKPVLMGLALAITLPYLFVINGKLQRLIRKFNSPWIDTVKDSEVKQLAHNLNQLVAMLTRVHVDYTEAAVSEMWPYKVALGSLEARSSHLQSVIEGLYLSVNEDFKDMITDSGNNLGTGQGCAHHGELIGKV